MTSLSSRLLDRLVCIVRRRHLYRLRGEAGRVFMECASCGVRSSGWDTGSRLCTIQTQPKPLRLAITGNELAAGALHDFAKSDRLIASTLSPDGLRLVLEDPEEHLSLQFAESPPEIVPPPLDAPGDFRLLLDG